MKSCWWSVGRRSLWGECRSVGHRSVWRECRSVCGGVGVCGGV